MGNAGGYWQKIEVESKIAYCSRCKIHGHELSVCRKAKASAMAEARKVTDTGYGPDNLFKVTVRNEQGEQGERQVSKASSLEWTQVRRKKLRNKRKGTSNNGDQILQDDEVGVPRSKEIDNNLGQDPIPATVTMVTAGVVNPDEEDIAESSQGDLCASSAAGHEVNTSNEQSYAEKHFDPSLKPVKSILKRPAINDSGGLELGDSGIPVAAISAAKDNGSRHGMMSNGLKETQERGSSISCKPISGEGATSINSKSGFSQ